MTNLMGPQTEAEKLREENTRLRAEILNAEDRRDGWERRYHAKKQEVAHLIGRVNLETSTRTSSNARADKAEAELERLREERDKLLFALADDLDAEAELERLRSGLREEIERYGRGFVQPVVREICDRLTDLLGRDR